MGGGSYSFMSRGARVEKEGTLHKSNAENFKSRAVTREMTTVGLTYRESRDSEEHPNSVPIIVALDVTGSMGSVPEHMVKHGLPHMMDGIIKAGNPDPQVLFMGIGDHVFDRSPLQVGQFESSDELLDKWLMDTYLEGGGGGNDGESYMLAWYFAARHTQLDSMEKRKEKGFLFTIGDEKNLDSVPGPVLEKIMGKGGQYGTLLNSTHLLEEARKMYHVYHIHIAETHSGKRPDVISHWKEIMGDSLIVVQSSDHVSGIIASIVSKSGSTEGVEDTPDKEKDQADTGGITDKPKEEEIL
jgi:hypothetical protein